MKQVRLTHSAVRDVAYILERSRRDFGARARDRYAQLLDRALLDLAEDPSRIGVVSIEDLRPDSFIYHLKFSRTLSRGRRVLRPRHVLVFRVEQDEVIVMRMLHERQLLDRHLD